MRKNCRGLIIFTNTYLSDLSSNNLGSDKPVSEKPFMGVGSRSSLDLGTLGRPLIGGWSSTSTQPISQPSAASNTANNHNVMGGPSNTNNGGHFMNGHAGGLDSLPSSRSSVTTEPSPPSSLPFQLQEAQGTPCHLDQLVSNALDNEEPDSNSTTLMNETVAFAVSSASNEDTQQPTPLSCAGEFF